MAQRNMALLSDTDLHADWVTWIQRAYDELIRQGWRHKMFRLMRGIYEQNADLRANGGFFLNWAADNYVAASAMALRRELDDQHGSQNLYHLLQEVRQRPEVVSRRKHRETWTGNSEYWTADKAFDQLPIIRVAANPDGDHIDPDVVAIDLRTLRSQDGVIEHIQTTIAHRAPMRAGAEVPTFADLHAAINVVREVFSRYYLILTHASVTSFEPMEQFNLFAPFRSAWITDMEQFDYSRCE